MKIILLKCIRLGGLGIRSRETDLAVSSSDSPFILHAVKVDPRACD